MIFGQLMRVLKARFWLILTVTAITVASAAAVSFLMSKRYVATASMVIDFPANDPVNGAVAFVPGSISGFLATQVDIIKSDKVVQKVIDKLALDADPATVEAFNKDTGGQGQLRPWLAGKLQADLTVEPAREGSTIAISYEARDPQTAARIANAFSQAFVATTLELKTEPARNYAAIFEQQAQQYRAELSAAQEKVLKFQQQSGITATDERLDVENTRLQELSSQLVQLQSLATESRSRQANTQTANRESLPEVVASPLIQGLKTELSRAEGRLQEMSARLGPSHPQMIAAQSEVASLRQRLDFEITRIAGSVTQGASVNESRVAQVRAAFEAQRAKVLQLKTQREQLSQLQRDVEAPQRALEMLTQRMTQSSIESRARLSNVSVVTPALVPAAPSRPKPVLNIALGAVFGLFLGILAAISLENVQRPLRSSSDMLQAVGVPVLAVLPPANARRPQRLIGNTGPTVGNHLQLGNG